MPLKQQARPHTPPRKSGGWAGVPSNATPKGHFAHRPNCNVKMVWHDAAANRHQLGSQLDAVDSQADLYVLPEMFNTGVYPVPGPGG